MGKLSGNIIYVEFSFVFEHRGISKHVSDAYVLISLWRLLYVFLISSLYSLRISLMNKTKAKRMITTRKTTPPSGFITSQFTIGDMMYAVINNEAKKTIVRSKSIVNINLAYTSYSLFLLFRLLIVFIV
jgi:hypothetical protein